MRLQSFEIKENPYQLIIPEISILEYDLQKGKNFRSLQNL